MLHVYLIIIYFQENVIFIFGLENDFIVFYYIFELVDKIGSKLGSTSGADNQRVCKMLSWVELMNIFGS